MTNALFTHNTKQDGYFGSGKIPSELSDIVSDIGHQFNSLIPEEQKTNSTYHVWYKDLPENVKNNMNILQNHPLWHNICISNNKCVLKNIKEMDELYYSNAPSQKKRGLLYGASGNYDLHIDGIFNFPGIRFYRILIGVTSGNTTVETSFPRINYHTKINKNDFLIFDFDKAQHIVKNYNDSNLQCYRILIKLHFCACDGCSLNSTYFKTICKLYEFYEIVTRYIMQTGTDPDTYIQFFFGLLSYISTHCVGVILLYVIFISIYIFLSLFTTMKLLILKRILIDVFIVYLVFVLLFWIQWKLFNVR